MKKKALAAVLSTLSFGTVSVSLAAEAPHDFGGTDEKGDGPKGIHKGGAKGGKKGCAGAKGSGKKGGGGGGGEDKSCSSEKSCGGGKK